MYLKVFWNVHMYPWKIQKMSPWWYQATMNSAAIFKKKADVCGMCDVFHRVSPTVSSPQCADKEKKKKRWDFAGSTLSSFTTNSMPNLAITHTRPSFFSMYVSIRGVLSLGWRVGFLDMLCWDFVSWFRNTSELKESLTSDDTLFPVDKEPQTENTDRDGFRFSVLSAQEGFIHQIMWRSLFYWWQ